MAQAQKGLGRGLEALLGGYQDEREVGDILTLALDAIRANPTPSPPAKSAMWSPSCTRLPTVTFLLHIGRLGIRSPLTLLEAAVTL